MGDGRTVQRPEAYRCQDSRSAAPRSTASPPPRTRADAPGRTPPRCRPPRPPPRTGAAGRTAPAGTTPPRPPPPPAPAQQPPPDPPVGPGPPTATAPAARPTRSQRHHPPQRRPRPAVAPGRAHRQRRRPQRQVADGEQRDRHRRPPEGGRASRKAIPPPTTTQPRGRRVRRRASGVGGCGRDRAPPAGIGYGPPPGGPARDRVSGVAEGRGAARLQVGGCRRGVVIRGPGRRPG